VILAAGVLVLLGAGLFVAGIVTDATDLYWSCVVACAAAGVLLVAARVRTGQVPPASAPSPSGPSTAGEVTTAPAATPPATAPATAEAEPESPAVPAEPAPPALTEPRAAAEHPPRSAGTAAHGGDGDPPVEDVEVTDLLLVMDLHDEVLVVDEHPRYHLAGCRWLRGRATVPLPLDEARRDGFTPCARCTPDRTLAERERGRRAGRNP
jgi:hypothetical protein